MEMGRKHAASAATSSDNDLEGTISVSVSVQSLRTPGSSRQPVVVEALVDDQGSTIAIFRAHADRQQFPSSSYRSLLDLLDVKV